MSGEEGVELQEKMLSKKEVGLLLIFDGMEEGSPRREEPH